LISRPAADSRRFVWTVAGGQTPPGLNLSESGRFSGTPQTQGSFAFTVQVRDSAQRTASQVFLISIGAAVPPIDFTLRNLSFTAFVNGDSPPAQTFDVVSASPAAFALTLDGGLPGSAPPSWMIVTLRNGRTPATITVEARPQGLLAGTYSGRVLATGSSGQELRLVVTLTVRAEPPRLSAAPEFVRFIATPAARSVERLLTVRNLGGGNPVALNVRLDPAVPWLTVGPPQATIQPDAPVNLRLQANAGSLTPGGYRTDVVVTPAQGEPVRVPVQLVVRPPGPAIEIDTTGVFLESLARVAAIRRRTVRITNSGDQTLNWRTEITQTSSWLTLNPASGQIPAGGSADVELAANPVSLAEGVQSALVRIIDPNAVNGPRFLVAVFRTVAPPAAPLPEFDPAGLVFTAAVGGPAPAAQRVRLFTLSSTPVAYQAAANPINPGQWLELASPTGNVSALTPVDLTVRVNPAGLAPGVYQGRLSVRIGTGQVRSGLITLIVRPALPASEARAAAGCTPSRLTLTPTSVPGNFAGAVGWPVPVALRLLDDCGDPAASGQVVVTFNNGDAPLPLLLNDPGSGVFSGTWTPGRAASPLVMTATATASGFPTLKVDVAGTVSANQAPILARNGTLNNLNPVVGGTLAPGTVVQVFGSNLAASQATPGILPLPATFGGTSVLVGGLQAPFYFLSPGQLNVQLPVELQANREHSIVVAAGGGYTLPDTLVTTPVQPGLAVFGQNQVIAQRRDGSIVQPDTPARPDEILVIYLVGMGAAAGNAATGQAVPVDPLPVAEIQPTVTIGGLPVTVFYAGLTPGFVGLYQINLAVPVAAPDGDLTIAVSQGEVPANSAVLPVRR
jgi:uncharacterized protein (TIGR03437 family)